MDLLDPVKHLRMCFEWTRQVMGPPKHIMPNNNYHQRIKSQFFYRNTVVGKYPTGFRIVGAGRGSIDIVENLKQSDFSKICPR